MTMNLPATAGKLAALTLSLFLVSLGLHVQTSYAICFDGRTMVEGRCRVIDVEPTFPPPGDTGEEPTPEDPPVEIVDDPVDDPPEDPVDETADTNTNTVTEVAASRHILAPPGGNAVRDAGVTGVTVEQPRVMVLQPTYEAQ